LIFNLHWPVTTVEQLSPEQIVHWLGRAIAHHERRPRR